MSRKPPLEMKEPQTGLLDPAEALSISFGREKSANHSPTPFIADFGEKGKPKNNHQLSAADCGRKAVRHA